MSPPFIQIKDIADILIMTFLLYQLYSWFYHTRAMQVLLGLGVVTLIYFATRALKLYMTSWILQELGTVLIVLLIVVFQSEIRQALYRFSLLRHLFERKTETKPSNFQKIVETIFNLARDHTGALIVFERNDPLEDLMMNGVKLNCEISPQIVETIFMDGTPLHDGAILIRNGQIAVAACHLPLSVNSDIPQYLGTRHRAAMGIAEKTDAIVAVVSEERGVVSLAEGATLQIYKTPSELIAALDRLIAHDPPPATNHLIPIPRGMFSNLLPKVAIFLFVTIFWTLLTSKQEQIITATAPVIIHGIPEKLVLTSNSPEKVDIQLKSFSGLAPMPSKLDVTANIDLSDIREGQTMVKIKNSDFRLPSGMEVTSVNPSSIRIVTDRKVRKQVPIKTVVQGLLERGLSGHDILTTPSAVEIEGPASRIERIKKIDTEDIYASELTTGRKYYKKLVRPENNIIILRDEPVTIQLIEKSKKQ